MEYRKKRHQRKLLIIFSLGAVLITAMVLGNHSYSVNNPGGNDFLVHWLGNRLFITEGQSPYSDETAEAIQTAAYGRPAVEGEHELRVAYPLYSIVVFFPFSMIEDFHWARAAWMTVLEMGIIALTFFSIRFIKWRPNLYMMAGILLFSLVWYHGLRPIINGNAVILVALFVVIAVWAIQNKMDELAGSILALSTIKPHLVLLVILFLLIWVIRKRRWMILYWFTGCVVLLVTFSVFLLPDWIIQNLREIVNYPAYNPPGTLQSALSAIFPGIGTQLGWIIAGLVALLLLFEWLNAFKSGKKLFVWTVCITLIGSQWIGITTDPGNFILLFPAIPLLLNILEKRWKKTGFILSVILLLLMLIGIWWVFLITVEMGAQPQQSPWMFLPLPGLLLVLLYWLRWWYVQSSTVWVEENIDPDESLFV